MQLSSSIQKAVDKFQLLFSFLIDFSYIIEDLNYETITEDLIGYGLELCREGSVQEQLENYAKARAKYESAQFILSELTIELYHTLKFSNEDTQSSSNEDVNRQRIDNKDVNCSQRVKSFTFDTNGGHRKLEFTRKDELMLSNIHKMVNQRIIECDKNLSK